MKFSSTQGGKTEAQAVHGTIEVSDGAEKFVRHSLEFALGSDKSQLVKTDLKATLIGNDKLTITGTFAGEGKPGAVNYTVSRNALGMCVVTK